MTNPSTVYNVSRKQAESQDTSLWDDVKRLFEGFEKTAYVKELKAVFDNLHDDELIEALENTRWTGRPGYPIPIMWRTLVASFYLNIIHDTDLIRALHSNPLLAHACGIDDPSLIPSKYAYCRFRKKLTQFNDLVAKALAQCVEALKEAIPEFSETVAVDATDVKAWANGMHQETDPDAGTGAKHKSSRRIYWYGYKVHLVADANSELPIWFHLTPANVYDGAHLPTILEGAKAQFGWFHPTHVLADKGYDSKECFRFVGEEMKAMPIIDVRMYSRRRPREGRPCEAYPVETPQGIRYRCNRVPYDSKCPRFGHCPMLPVFVDSPLNTFVALSYYERYIPFPYGSKEWKTLYDKRVSVERVFSRLKTYRKLNAVRVRRMKKVWLHVALSLLTMNAAALARVGDDSTSVRACVRS
jgi:hypothetical protein